MVQLPLVNGLFALPTSISPSPRPIDPLTATLCHYILLHGLEWFKMTNLDDAVMIPFMIKQCQHYRSHPATDPCRRDLVHVLATSRRGVDGDLKIPTLRKDKQTWFIFPKYRPVLRKSRDDYVEEYFSVFWKDKQILFNAGLNPINLV